MRATGYFFKLLFTLTLIAKLSLYSEASSLRVATFLSEPYQASSPSGLSGSSVATLNCVAERLNWAYELKTFPRKRAIRALQSGKADAMGIGAVILGINPHRALHDKKFQTQM